MITTARRTSGQNPQTMILQAAASQAFQTLFRLDHAEATELLLVHHAEPDVPAGLRTGNPDPPLTERGRCQAMRLAMRLRRERVDAVYTSTARPALETAAVIAAAHDLPMVRAPQLTGVAGATCRSPEKGMPALAREMTLRFLNRPRWDALPGFEPSLRFRRRAIQALEAIAARHGGQRVVIVTHDSVVNAYLSMILGIDRDMFFLPEHGSISSVRIFQDLYGVQTLNDCSHLMPTFSPK